ncbi:hypothetical protein NBRC111894_1610 [Sporolactobacillus inulinus]|uniref:Uncharacterized protein n=1 Tax=Sporolactobacillus inulinus TaxID=2078 RepID=A0A4Y1ZAG9_9BACL|nr:hypothetical protein NBRC111894_1610 [Sporolactobacillus inulinus]
MYHDQIVNSPSLLIVIDETSSQACLLHHSGRTVLILRGVCVRFK